MSGSVYGTIFKISTWGESHGSGVGVVVDGCPAGLLLNEEDIQKYLDRRKPGQSKFTTARSEGDKAEILSGVFEGKTTGTPISIVIRTQTSAPVITAISWMCIVRAMLIIPLMKNMVSGITGAVDVLPEERPLEEWQQVL